MLAFNVALPLSARSRARRRPSSPTPTPALPATATPRLRPRAELDVNTAVSLVVAGFALSLTGLTAENVLNNLYRTSPTPRRAFDEELCDACNGFGSVRCTVCRGEGTITNQRARSIRCCPLCSGRKRERCKRCAGRGTMGIRRVPKTSESAKAPKTNKSRHLRWP